MSEQKKYLDNIGLETYDGLIKGLITEEVNMAKVLSNNNLETAKSHADTGDEATILAAQTYTDSALAQKSQVRINIWEADD